MFVLRSLANSFVRLRKSWMQIGLFGVLLCLQVAGRFYTYPYYYTYLNPIMAVSNPVPVFFYGERMEAAGAYLTVNADLADLAALVYFGGAFSYYFPGKKVRFRA